MEDPKLRISSDPDYVIFSPPVVSGAELSDEWMPAFNEKGTTLLKSWTTSDVTTTCFGKPSLLSRIRRLLRR